MKKLTLQAQATDDGERLDRFIARAGAVARGEARRALDRGGVWVEGKRVKVASRTVRAGQSVTVVLEEGGRSAPAVESLAPERILFEDEHLIAVDKPPFVPAQATLATDKGSLVDLVSRHLGRPAGLVHRLDLETSGVTVFGKTRAATSALAGAFREGTAQKRYLAVAWGALPDAGRIDLPLAPDPRRKGRFVAGPEHGVPAGTRYEVKGRRAELCAVSLVLETGRTHQIRAHLTALGAPLVGDTLYGGPRELPAEPAPIPVSRVMLHARELVLPHPATNAPLALRAPVPEDLAGLWSRAGGETSEV